MYVASLMLTRGAERISSGDITKVKLTWIKGTEANVAHADPTGATWSNPAGPDE